MKFVRQDYMRHLKLGKSRKKLLRWRKPRGRDSKMRTRRIGYPATVSIGYGSPKSNSNKINGKNFVVVNNMKELENTDKNNLVILSSRLGARKKMEMIKKAEQMNIQIHNLRRKK